MWRPLYLTRLLFLLEKIQDLTLYQIHVETGRFTLLSRVDQQARMEHALMISSRKAQKPIALFIQTVALQ